MSDEGGECSDLPDGFRQAMFQSATLSPGSWRIDATRHKRAADILYEVVHRADARLQEWLRARVLSGDCTAALEGDVLSAFADWELLDDYLLLIGYGLECLTKGYLLAVRPELLVGGEKLHSSIKTHDLVALFRACRIEVTDEEVRWLDRITKAVIWGKYPAPGRLDEWPARVNVMNLDRAFGDERRLQTLIDGLFARVGDLVNREVDRRK